MAAIDWISVSVAQLERTYALEYDKVTTGMSMLMKQDYVTMLLYYANTNIDLVRNERFILLAAKIMNVNMTSEERDQTMQNAGVDYVTSQRINELVVQNWPEPQQLPTYTIDLPTLRARLEARVNFEAGNIRSKVITVAPGKDLVYIGKVFEVRDFINDSEPTPEKYPLIALEVKYGGEEIDTLAKGAALIQATYDQWHMLATVIEDITKGAIQVLRDPTITDVNELTSAANIDWVAALPMLFGGGEPT